jgi:organic radical activating enzyme
MTIGPTPPYPEDDMNQLQQIAWSEDPVLFITWQTSDVCNYRCSYCNPGNWGGNQPNEDLVVYQRNLEGILDQMWSKGYRKIKLFLSGGEPTHWQGMLPMLQWFRGLSDWRTTVAVNTNLSKPTVWWERFYHHFDDVVASYHPEWVKHDVFMANAQLLSTNVNYLAVRMMMAEAHWDSQLTRADEIFAALPNVTLEYVPILGEMSIAATPYVYTDKRKEDWLARSNLRIKHTADKPRNRVGGTHTMEIWADGTTRPVNSNRLAAERANFFAGWQCDIGSSINIAINGDITLASCGQSGVIGNIGTEVAATALPSSIVCAKHHCHCGTDICIPKRMVA